MNIANVRVGVRLGGAFALVVLFVVAIGLFGQWQMQRQAQVIEQFHLHPYAVRTNLLAVNADLVRVHRSMKDVALSSDDASLAVAIAAVDGYETDALAKFDVLYERYLGDKSELDALRELIVQWRPIRARVIERVRAGDRAGAAAITRNEGAAHVKQLEDMMAGINDFASRKADAFVANASAAAERSRLTALLAIALAALLASATAWLITRSITRPLARAATIAARVAQGNLDVDTGEISRDELGDVLRALHNMSGKLAEIVGEVRGTAHAVGAASQQIAQGNNDLSQRAQAQASALEETASSMEEMTATVRATADNAALADRLAKESATQAGQGREVVAAAMEAMQAIRESSRRISDIIAVIDEIAFQTNLLALNAAVEAARAGESGRGFAVVASEVRNLAQRSASAAKDIKGLIGDAEAKVARGAELVDRTGQALAQILEGAGKVNGVVTEIAQAASEQAGGIDQVNLAVVQMDEMTQHNAALVEEAAAASQALLDQADGLIQVIAWFRVADDTGARVARPARVPLTTGAPDAGDGDRDGVDIGFGVVPA